MCHITSFHVRHVVSCRVVQRNRLHVTQSFHSRDLECKHIMFKLCQKEQRVQQKSERGICSCMRHSEPWMETDHSVLVNPAEAGTTTFVLSTPAQGSLIGPCPEAADHIHYLAISFCQWGVHKSIKLDSCMCLDLRCRSCRVAK